MQGQQFPKKQTQKKCDEFSPIQCMLQMVNLNKFAFQPVPVQNLFPHRTSKWWDKTFLINVWTTAMSPWNTIGQGRYKPVLYKIRCFLKNVMNLDLKSLYLVKQWPKTSKLYQLLLPNKKTDNKTTVWDRGIGSHKSQKSYFSVSSHLHPFRQRVALPSCVVAQNEKEQIL